MKTLNAPCPINLAFTLILFTAMSIAAFKTNAVDANEVKRPLSKQDLDFASNAMAGGIMEVTLGQMAAERGSSEGVKTFGEQMAADHKAIGEKLKAIVESRGVTLPVRPTATQQQEIDSLSKLTGANFDKKYVSLMIDDHKKDLKEFRQATRVINDQELKIFAASTAAAIEHHLQMAQALSASLKSGN